VAGQTVRFTGCPVKHLDGAHVGRYLSWYRWLNRWNVTPGAWGIPPERIDPRFPVVVEIIDNELARQREEERAKKG